MTEEPPIPSFADLLPSKAIEAKINEARLVIENERHNPDWSARLLVSMVDEKKRIMHSAIVGYCCQAVAQTINKNGGLPKIDANLLLHAGMLHDIGQYGTTLGRTPWHEIKGAIILQTLGLTEIARIVSRHATLRTLFSISTAL